MYLSSPTLLLRPAATLGELFLASAKRSPERDFLLERREGELRRVTYAEAQATAERVAGWLLSERHTAVGALSGNSVDAALVMLGCFLAGIPYVPISPAYSLLSQNLEKLQLVLDKVRPSCIYTDRADFKARGAAIAATRATPLVASDLERLPAREERGVVGPDHVAKILFTSGSTGFPKGVPNTHRMLCSNQQMIAQCWPFLSEDEVLVDWLPWSHTFGGNHNFNLVLATGATLLVDEGRPNAIDATIANLSDEPPTLYFNVPAGFAALVPRLEGDDAFASRFFSRLRMIFYAAAALPPDLWKRLVALSERHSRSGVFMTTAWGSTETSPLATSTHFEVPEAGNIGLPAPGVTLKLVPSGNKTEVRVRGPNVMTGYLDEPGLTAACFDEEGFYRMGDAVKLADPDDPAAGLLFDGRVAEDFKLSSGTWVSVTNVRTGLVAEAGGILADIVVCGHDREHLAILAWPSVAGCKAVVPEGTTIAALSVSEVVHEHVRQILTRWNRENPGSSTRVTRALLLGDPPSIDAGEITDKGYTNQRAALDRRAAEVADLYAEPAASGVIFG